jgi:DNA polymerase (family 10)
VPVHNAEIERIFNQTADLLEIEGANEFRVRAYRNAARAMGGLSAEAADMLGQGQDLTELPGIGKDLAGKISTIVETGSLPLLEELKGRLPSGLLDMLQVDGLGPKRVAALYKELGVQNLDGLKQAAESGKVRELSGFGQKSEQKILSDLGREKPGAERVKLAEARPYAESLKKLLQEVEGVRKLALAGSYRRRKETVGDLDVLAACEDSGPVMDAFTGYEDVDRVVSRGETKSTVVLRSGLQVDLRVVPGESYGAALHYFTGSKAHNIHVRKIGVSRGYKINEYGVFEGDKQLAGATEEEVYAAVGLPYIEPELREDRGEIEAASKGGLPELLRLEDIRGDLHMHSDETDGRSGLKELAEAAGARGYEYIAVTDHSRRITVARGLDEDRLLKQIEAVDALNEELDCVTLLKGIEVDILKNGSLDLPDRVLEKLDLTVCSVHSYLDLPRDEQTERIIKAMDNRYFNILGHPTGRQIGARRPMDLDMERLMEAAVERGCFMELNCQPDRLDLVDVHLMAAKEVGLRVAVSTDAHWSEHLEHMRLGVDTARRGWLEAKDVINSESLGSLLGLFRR